MGDWNATPVQAIRAIARFGYLEREVQEASVTRSMYDAHPAHPHRSPSSSAEVTVRPQGAQANAPSTSPNPLAPAGYWPPKPGNPVRVDVSDGAGLVTTVMSGITDDVDGAYTTAEVTASVVDLVERLDRSMQGWGGTLSPANALLGVAPPVSGSRNEPWRELGVSSIWQVDNAARRGGFQACAERRWESRLVVPMMGSLRPDVGGIQSATRNDTSRSMAMVSTPWGVTMYNAHAEYALIAPSSGGTITEMVLDLPPRRPDDGPCCVVLRDTASDAGYYVHYSPSSDLITAGIQAGSDSTEVLSLPRDGRDRVAIRCTRTYLAMKRAGDSTAVVGSGFQYRPGTWDATSVRTWSSASMCPIEVADDPAPWSTLDSPRTARIRGSRASSWWTAARSTHDKTARQVLEEVADAECAAWWIDSEGVLQWAGYGVLEAQPVSETITTLDSLADCEWTLSRDSLAVTVVSSRLRPSVRVTKDYRTIFSTVSVTDLEGGDDWETIVTTPDDEDWINPDLTLTRASDSMTHLGWTRVGSVAAIEQSNVDDPEVSYWDTTTGVTLEFITQRAYKWAIYALAGPKWRVNALVPEAATRLPKSTRGRDGLILRGGARIRWVEESSSQQTGSPVGGEYVHNFGPYVQSGASRSEVLSYVVDELGRGLPRVTARVRPRPGRQVGARVRLVDSTSTGLTLTCIVQTIRETWAEGDATQVLDCRVVSWSRDDTLTPVTPAPHWLQVQGNQHRAT